MGQVPSESAASSSKGRKNMSHCFSSASTGKRCGVREEVRGQEGTGQGLTWA